jgi:hypothetical protein
MAVLAMLSRMTGFLLDNANPSIKLRVRSEILHDITPEEEAQYREQILREPIVQRIIACQQENGWLGDGFHGTSANAGQFENQETGTKYLAEKAVGKDTPVLRRAMEAFATVPLDDPCYRTRGRIFDEFRLAANGQNLIRCACISRAGYDVVIDISPQIELSLDSFKRVLEVDSILDISRPINRGRNLVFNDGERWPCRYHLDMLAHTQSWKSDENIKMIADSTMKLMRTDRPELIGLVPLSWVGYALGTLGALPSQGFSIKTSTILPSPVANATRKPDLYNLEYIEWFAGCGVVPHVPALHEAVCEIADAVGNDGVCRIPVVDDIFKGWGPYAGLRLEVDWRSKVRRDCDITFRALLILHYSNVVA